MVFAFIASIGVVLAAVYALRLYIRSMHNRTGPAVTSFEMSVRDALVLVPLVLVIVAFALKPQAALDHAEPSVKRVVAPRAAGGRRAAGRDGGAPVIVAQVQGPEIDWAALSPLVALTAGACLVLLPGLARARVVRTRAVPVLALVTLAATAGLAIWQWNENESIIEGALAMDDFTLGLTLLFCAAGIGTVLLSWRSAAAPRPARASTTRCC